MQLIFSLICVVLQIIVLAYAYFGWKKDCKKFGKEKLAVPLGERIWAGFLCFPFWLGPIIAYCS